jgi:hypothetical protein
MFERLQEQQWAVYAVLYDSEVTEAKYRSYYPKEDQWALLTQMTSALKPLQVAMTAFCEADIVSVSLVYPIICSLVTTSSCTRRGFTCCHKVQRCSQK